MPREIIPTIKSEIKSPTSSTGILLYREISEDDSIGYIWFFQKKSEKNEVVDLIKRFQLD